MTELVNKVLVKLIPQTFAVHRASQSSVEIRRGAKSVEITVKSYADNVEEAAEKAKETYLKLTNEISPEKE